MIKAAEPAVETELKFIIAPADLPALRALDMFTGLADERQLLEATYFDTSEGALHDAGYSLRLRRAGDRVVQTLKGSIAGGSGLVNRSEHEQEVADGALDEGALASVLPPRIFDRIKGRLAPYFTVAVTRSSFEVAIAEGTVSVSLDEGQIVAGDRGEPVVEVEFELIAGDVAAIFALARAAMDAAPLHLQPLAKSDRGHRLAGGASAVAEPPLPSADPQATTGATLRTLAAALARSIAIQRAAVMTDNDAEAIHRLRVSLRKLRALVALAERMLPGAIPDAIDEVARRTFRRLGKARDLDILQAIVPVNQMAAAEELAAIGRGRNAALLRARELLASRAFAGALLDLVAFAEGVDRTGAEPSGDAPAAAAAAHVLEACWRDIHRSRPPRRLGPDARHRLRIRAKRLRDATELLDGLFADGKAAKREHKLAADLHELQDQLGSLNDRQNAWKLGKEWLGKPLAISLGLKPDPAVEAAAIAAADTSFRQIRKRPRYWL